MFAMSVCISVKRGVRPRGAGDFRSVRADPMRLESASVTMSALCHEVKG